MATPSRALSPTEKLAAGIVRVVNARVGLAPYFGVALRGLLRRQMPPQMEAALVALHGCATLAVTADGVLYWSPSYVQKLPVDELAFRLMHEVMHVLLGHFARSKVLGVTPETASISNIAQDCCINEELHKTWPKLGADGVYPEMVGQAPGLVYEARYRLLLKDRKEQEGGGGDKNGKGQNGKNGQDGSGVGKGHCGSAAGNEVPGEEGGQGRSEAQLERIRKETAQAVKAHIEAKGRGDVPAGLDVWADTQLAPPKIDWRVRLGQLVRAAVAYRKGSVDFDWSRMSRRQAGLGFGVGAPIVPSFRAPVPRVSVVIDSSGSMGAGPGSELAAAASELQGLMAAVGASVTVCVVDAAVHGLAEVDSIEAALKLVKGGGGTDLGPGVRALAERVPRCECAILLTDGEIPDPGEEPPFRVVWCVVGGFPFEAPWGEVVRVDEAEVKP